MHNKYISKMLWGDLFKSPQYFKKLPSLFDNTLSLFNSKADSVIKDMSLKNAFALSGSDNPADKFLSNKYAKESIGLSMLPESSDINLTDGTSNPGMSASTANLIGAGLDMVGSFLPSNPAYLGTYGNLSAGTDLVTDIMGNGIAAFDPFVGTLFKGAQFIGKGLNAIGGGTDGMTRKDAILGSNIGTLLTFGLNGFTGRRANTVTKDNLLFEDMGASYGGTDNAMDEALKTSGKKYGGVSRKEFRAANTQSADASTLLKNLNWIAGTTRDLLARRHSMSSIVGNRRNYNLHGGYDHRATRVGLNGLSFTELLNNARKFLEKSNNSEEIKFHKDGGTLEVKPTEILLSTFDDFEGDIEEFQKGGSVNIIPEGSLHARKHNMEVEGITHKGIPVVAEKEGGEIELQAEIEREEIIFRLEVTLKLEELCKKYNEEDASLKDKDEAALEAGKLLTKEILHNTIDNTKNLL